MLIFMKQFGSPRDSIFGSLTPEDYSLMIYVPRSGSGLGAECPLLSDGTPKTLFLSFGRLWSGS